MMDSGFFQFVQQVFMQAGAQVEQQDAATFKLRIKRDHPHYEKLVALFHEFQTRANTNGVEVQHLYKPGGSDRLLELMRDILGPEQHDRLVADLEQEQRRLALDTLSDGAAEAMGDSQVRAQIMQRAFEERLIPASSLPTSEVNKVDAEARGEKVEE